ncbi:ABC transporter ATP-binding protein [Olsenella sp. Marseille-P4559]|jgi:ATP-binding cassette subfamily B protein|uniref:ABC transporter ATP-binding protein n=1 Tax=Olsenella sp. Marseille-P4559 TaxID=2364795 RepID=UPI0010325D53|nr:ABC transporter ATP-binding protein [Olsenella sp. Marseille-P4559]MCH3955779.1 ABC transporter ATP-binding protein/permease [Olsenella sp.]MCI2156636.1 ABC transporter ATP-binding protein/permease [Olsenella sp.]MCI2160094.1 ABC transporter ATP-binding protein/permease [Olsenella sp.]MCI2187841.1 ABC transporter ATP-binding protein/permease [Olsenella sp.]
MKELLRRSFALTDDGARGLIRSSVSYFFYYLSLLLPMMLVFFLAWQLTEGQEPNIWLYVGLLAASAAVMYVAVDMNYRVSYNETYRETANIRIDLASRMKELPLSFFTRHDVSDLAQVLTADVAALEHALAHGVANLIGFVAYFILGAVLMLLGDARLALCILVPIAFSIALVYLTKRLQVQIRTEQYAVLREISEEYQTAIDLSQEIKSYQLKEAFRARISSNLVNAEKLQWGSELAQVIPLSAAQAITVLPIGITLAVGVHLLAQGQATLLFVVGYVVAAAMFSRGVNNVFQYLAEIFYLDARVKKIEDIRDTPTQEGVGDAPTQFDVALSGVRYSYDGMRQVLDGVTFKARQGEVTALVGPSGCGKTTLLRVISRLVDYDSGSISIGGCDIKEMDTEALFNCVSIVFQDVVLFNTSVLENIRIGRLDATDDEVKHAAELAGCDDFVSHLPDGYGTAIGENGARLSGGERARISIARALLKDAPIIILDEIAAALDVESEARVQEGLNKLVAGKTVIVISHRMKSIENANNIVVLDNGQVQAAGTHDQLMEECPLYRSLVERSVAVEQYSY